jgi:hypothetical protein
MLSVDLSMTGRDYDFEELRPLGEASRRPDHQLDGHSTAAPRRQRRASVETGYPEHPTEDEAECRSCGAPIPASQTKCRFCLTNHLGDSDTSTTETGQEATLVGIVFALVQWLREFNAERPLDDRVRFYGIDAQYTTEAVEYFDKFLASADPYLRDKLQADLPATNDEGNTNSQYMSDHDPEATERLLNRLVPGSIYFVKTLRCSRIEFAITIASIPTC